MPITFITDQRSGHLLLTSADTSDIGTIKAEIDNFIAQVRVGDSFHLKLEISFGENSTNKATGTDVPLIKRLHDAIEEDFGGNVRRAFPKLGISRSTFYSWMSGSNPSRHSVRRIIKNAPLSSKTKIVAIEVLNSL
jgi:acetylornithine deacetylase/succinyl-diaminopimelate desuccinylase-like protein